MIAKRLLFTLTSSCVFTLASEEENNWKLKDMGRLRGVEKLIKTSLAQTLVRILTGAIEEENNP